MIAALCDPPERPSEEQALGCGKRGGRSGRPGQQGVGRDP